MVNLASLSTAARRLASTSTEDAMWWILRAAAAACFIGHGAFGLRTKPEWVPFFGVVGIAPDTAYVMMPLIGVVDVAVGLAVLLRPSRVLLLYMTGWALWTAALRPLSGGSVFELVERAGNYGVPLAMLLLLGRIEGASLERVLAATTALLLFGHGALAALDQKVLLQTHVEAIGLSSTSAVAGGWLEMALAVLVLVRPRPALLLGVVCWKVGTELLYPIAGAPLWEFVERGGSYGAPLALAVLRARGASRPAALRHGGVASSVAVLLLVAFLATPASAQERMGDSTLVAALRGGGLVLACRHTATDHQASDQGPDRASQRNLTEEGVRQAGAIGVAIRKLRIPIGEVRANPMYRNRETAEYAFGRATVDSALGGTEAIAALRALLTAPVPRGTNRVLVTRIGILTGAFEGRGVGPIDEGDCLIVRPLAEGPFRVLGHLKGSDWARLPR
jgi:hypothetical protein